MAHWLTGTRGRHTPRKTRWFEQWEAATTTRFGYPAEHPRSCSPAELASARTASRTMVVAALMLAYCRAGRRDGAVEGDRGGQVGQW